MPRPRILLAIQQVALRQALKQMLQEIAPVELHEAASAQEAYGLALKHSPQLVVIGTGLTGFDGLQLTHQLRENTAFQDLPIILLGPKGDQARKYQAFYVGANDYVELPFDRLELSYRLRVQLRTPLQAAQTLGPLTLIGCQLDPITRTGSLGGQKAVLTPSEFALLWQLAKEPGVPMSTEHLLAAALGQPVGLGNPQVVHTHMRNLRRKLEAIPARPVYLQRHPAGYQLVLES
jgi:DNA-binding response OmpR family regulator